MNRFSGFFIVSLLSAAALPATAQEGGFMPLNSSQYQQSAAEAKVTNAVTASLDRMSGLLTVNSVSDVLSFDQLQSVISQFPGAQKILVAFPNQSQWMTSPSEILNLHNDFLQQAENLGFGMNGVSIPQMVFSSLKEGASGLDAQVPGGLGNLAMLPITNLKGAMSDTIGGALKQMRFDQLSLGDWMPDWLKSVWLSIYNFVMPYYYSAVNWVSSFF